MGKYRDVTRKDVAARANVSETIVSYVINDNRYVDKDKKARVLEAVKELNYVPNSIARTLRGKNSNHILFIVDSVVTERFGKMINEIDKVAYKNGLLISLTGNRNNDEFVRSVINRRFDGVIISSISFRDEFIKALVNAKIPVVLLATKSYDHIKDVVVIETGLYKAAKDCVEYFYNKGRRNIIYVDRISKNNRFSDMNDNRYRGFTEKMIELNLENDGHMLSGYESEVELEDALEKYLSENKVDAIIGRTDYISCVALNKAKSLGYKIPEDIGIIGFDDSRVCNLVTPKLSSVRLNKGIDKLAIETIYKIQEEGKELDIPEHYAELIIRESSE